MSKSTAVIVGVLVVVATAVGLSARAAHSTSGQAADTPRLTTTPAPHHTIARVVWDLPLGEPASVDPILSYNYSESTILSNLCDTLLIHQTDGKIVPHLATSVKHPNATTWVYTIRKGVHFWDGAPLTADDVVFSLTRSVVPKYGSYYNSPWGAYIKSVKKSGANQVTVVTKFPNVAVNDMMSSGLGMVTEKRAVLKAKSAYGTPKVGIMCSGPFKFVSWTPGSNLVIQRNANYWDKSLRSKANEVDFRFVTDPNTLTQALLNGTIDGAYESPVAGVTQLQNTSQGKLYLGRNLQTLSMLIANPGGTLGNPRVRQALSMMIDRTGLANATFAGTARPLFAVLPAGMTVAAPGVYAPASKKLVTTPNLNRAKALVKAANPPNKPAVLAVTQGDSASIAAATIIQAAGKQLGIDMPIRQLTGAQFGSALFSPSARKPFAAMIGNTYTYTPLEYMMTGWLPHAATNLVDYNDDKTTALIHAADATTDLRRQSQLLAQAETRTMDWSLPEGGAMIPIVDFAERLYMDKKVTGAPACFCYLDYPWAARLGAP